MSIPRISLQPASIATLTWFKALGFACVLLALGTSTSEAGLVAFWDFESDSTTSGGIHDQSGSGHDGSAKTAGSGTVAFGSNVPAEIAPRSTTSLDLTGNTAGSMTNVGWVEIDSPDYTGVLGSGPRTVSLWVNMTSTADQGILQWGAPTPGNLWSLRVDQIGTVGAVQAEVHSGWMRGSTNLADGQWHHLAVVLPDAAGVDITDALIYVDGSLEAITLSDPQAVNTTAGFNVLIGYEDAFNKGALQGRFDEVAIFDAALDADAIALLAGGISPLELPEPSALLMLATGLFAVFLQRRRRRGV